ncbi:MAG: putative excisionase, DNA-binding [Rhizobacter sp.]|nr:putative excisionase, DNA-binding [Rhizobacter sp.]
MIRAYVPPAVRPVPAKPDLRQPKAMDPLEPLAEAVEEALHRRMVLVPSGKGGVSLRVDKLAVEMPVGKHKQAEQPLAQLREALKHIVADALEASLGAKTAQGKRLRMAMVSKLARLEMGEATDAALPTSARRSEADDRLLTTAEVATRLGMSRPYVSMLCDQGKLGEISKSEGGHRRIQPQVVDAYQAAQKLAHTETLSPREAAASGNMYAVSEEDFIKGTKRAPTKGRKKTPPTAAAKK